jgi:hypothetical protein
MLGLIINDYITISHLSYLKSIKFHGSSNYSSIPFSLLSAVSNWWLVEMYIIRALQKSKSKLASKASLTIASQ